MTAPILYANKDLRIGQRVMFNDTFERDYPEGYNMLKNYIYIIKGFTNRKMFAKTSFHGIDTVLHTAYLKDIKDEIR